MNYKPIFPSNKYIIMSQELKQGPLEPIGEYWLSQYPILK